MKLFVTVKEQIPDALTGTLVWRITYDEVLPVVVGEIEGLATADRTFKVEAVTKDALTLFARYKKEPAANRLLVLPKGREISFTPTLAKAKQTYLFLYR